MDLLNKLYGEGFEAVGCYPYSNPTLENLAWTNGNLVREDLNNWECISVKIKDEDTFFDYFNMKIENRLEFYDLESEKRKINDNQIDLENSLAGKYFSEITATGSLCLSIPVSLGITDFLIQQYPTIAEGRELITILGGMLSIMGLGFLSYKTLSSKLRRKVIRNFCENHNLNQELVSKEVILHVSKTETKKKLEDIKVSKENLYENYFYNLTETDLDHIVDLTKRDFSKLENYKQEV